MGFDARRLIQAIADGNVAHADRDGLTGLRRDLFLMRGGHAPGEACPNEPPSTPDPHQYWCESPDGPCGCGIED